MKAFSPEEKCDHDESLTTWQSRESLLCDILQMVSIISVLVLKALPVMVPSCSHLLRVAFNPDKSLISFNYFTHSCKICTSCLGTGWHCQLNNHADLLRLDLNN